MVKELKALIDRVAAEYGILRDRIVLTGSSMGGYGTWEMGMCYPETFAAIAPVCGGGMAWNAGVLDMPIRVFHGAEDNLVDVRNSDEMVDKLKFLGKNVQYTRLDGVMHNVWDHTYDAELMEWFLSKSL
jgi:predicted peptidase